MYLTDRDEAQLERIRATGLFECPEFERVSHLMPCPECGHAYVDHPQHIPWTFLTILCDGRIVKL